MGLGIHEINPSTAQIDAVISDEAIEAALIPLGTKADATGTGAVADTKTAMTYAKQLVTELQVVDGIVDDLNTDLGEPGDAHSVATVFGQFDLLKDNIAAIPTTAQRGTDNAALASVLGALNDTAAAGAVTDTDTGMAYIKQIVTDVEAINLIVGSPQTLSVLNDTVAQGFYAATTLSAVDTDLAAGNIKKDIVIFGKTGTYTTEAANPITATDVVAPHIGFVNGGTAITGTVTEKVGSATILTPSTIDQAIPEGRYGGVVGDGKVLGDANLIAANILSGATIFTVGGAATVRDIADADAAVGEVKTGSKFYAVTGTVKTGSGTQTPDTSGELAAGYYEHVHLDAVDTDLAAANIKHDVVIFGKTGTYDHSDAPITVATVKTGLEGYVNGALVTGSGTKTLTDADDHVHAGYYEETTLAAVDTDLAVGNIAVGATIFGFAGTYTAGGEVKATGTVTVAAEENAEAGNTVLIDAKTYTFVAEIGVTEGNVLIGTAPESLDNLKAAINFGTGNGTLYVCAAAHPTVEATTNTDTVQTLQARTAGHAGNVTLTVTADHLTASAATLTGGLSAAVAGDIATGHFAWVNGVKLSGSA